MSDDRGPLDRIAEQLERIADALDRLVPDREVPHRLHRSTMRRRGPRKSGAQLLTERVALLKHRLPRWRHETPSGPQIVAALDGSPLATTSAGVVTELRRRMDVDRIALASATSTSGADR